MTKALALLILLVGLAGCTASPPLQGNFNANTTAANDLKMASDAINQLVALYPPASTTLSLQHATPDVFGTSLVELARQKGYAVLELKPEQGKPTAIAKQGLPFGYTLDSSRDSNIHWITLQIGNQILTRAYVMEAGTTHAAGSWARKE